MLGILTTILLLVIIGIFAFVAVVLGSGLGLFIVAFLVVVMVKHVVLTIKRLKEDET